MHTPKKIVLMATKQTKDGCKSRYDQIKASKNAHEGWYYLLGTLSNQCYPNYEKFHDKFYTTLYTLGFTTTKSDDVVCRGNIATAYGPRSN